MSPRIVDRDGKRLKIAHAAAELFGENGFDRTRINDVAARAGVGKGTIYEYFKNKEELMEGAFKLLMADMIKSLIPPISEESSAVAILEQMTMNTIGAMAHLGEGYRFFLEYMLYISRIPDGYNDLAELLNDYRSWLTALLEKGKRDGEFREDIDSFETAAAFVAWFDGVVLHWYVLPRSVSLEQMGRRYLEMTLKGLVPPRSANGEGEGS